MNAFRRAPAAIALLVPACVALLVGCSDTKTPTEMVEQATPVPATSLSGVVRERAGNTPFGGPGQLSCVLLPDRSSYWVSIGPTGIYSISGLRAGQATVNVYVKGQLTPQSFDMNLEPGANTRDFAVVVPHGAPSTMSGTVPSTLNWLKPPGMTVFCQGKSATVGSDGRYALSGLESGRWDVVIDLNNAFDHSSFPDITLAPGSNAIDFVIR